MNSPKLLEQIDPELARLIAWYCNEQKRKLIPASSQKVARNELCPCGSGKKFKKCCMR